MRRVKVLLVFLATVMLLSVTLCPAIARNKEKDLEKVRGDNLCGVVVTTKTNSAPGALPYDPLEGVEVKVDGTKFKTVTDSNGVFQLKVPAGSYKLVCQKAGVGMVTKDVVVNKGALPTMITIVLNPGTISASPNDFAPGGFLAPQTPGTAYVALAQKAAPGAPAGTNPAGGPSITTTQTYRQMIMMGGDPFSMGGGNVAMPMPGDINPGAYHTQMNVSPNSLMMLSGDKPGDPSYKEVPKQPFWVTFNASGSRLFVSTIDKMVQVYDTVNGNTLLTSIPAGGIVTDLKLSQDGNYVLAAVMGSNPNILLIDPRNNAPQRSVPVPMMRTGQVGQPRAAAVNREATRMFIVSGDSTSGELVAVDLFTGIPQAAIPVGANPTGMELSPDGRFLYVVNCGSGDVSVVDAWTFTEMGRVRVGVSPQKVAISPDGSRVFITNKGNDCVTVLNGLNQSPIATVPVGKGPVGVAVSSDGSKAYVGCTGSGNVTILDAHTGGVLMSTSPLPNSVPWGVAVRP